MNYLILLFSFLSGGILFGQNVEISGSIMEDNTPIIFANIYLENTNLGTTTDEKGIFSFKVPQGHHNIIVQAVGYKTYKEHLDVLTPKPQELKIQLNEDVLGLNQVVVSASRTGQIRQTAPVIVSVTTTKDFQATQSISLSEGLNFQPGLRMASDGRSKNPWRP